MSKRAISVKPAPASLDLRFFVAKQGGADYGTVYYWQPTRTLENAAPKLWRRVRLDEPPIADPAERLRVCEQRAHDINMRVNAWRRGEPIEGAPPPATPVIAGTLDALINAYKASHHFQDNLERSTKDTYRGLLAKLSAWGGTRLARTIKAPQVHDLYLGRRDKNPRQAGALVVMLHRLYELAPQFGVPIPADGNPCSNPGIKATRLREPQPWKRWQVQLFVARADAMGWPSVGTAVLLNYWLGQRLQDVLGLPRIEPRDTNMLAFNFRQRKTKQRVYLPAGMVGDLTDRISDELKRQAERGHRGDTLLLHETTGKPWDRHTFKHTFAEIRDCDAPATKRHHARSKAAVERRQPVFGPLPLSGLIFRELRHTAVMELDRAGCTTRQIANITGHKPGHVETILESAYRVHDPELSEQAFTLRLEHQRRRELEGEDA